MLAAVVSGGSVGVVARHAAVVVTGRPGPGPYYPMVGFFSDAAVFPIYLNLVPAVERQVDSIKGEYL
jgi:hypothetical protein